MIKQNHKHTLTNSCLKPRDETKNAQVFRKARTGMWRRNSSRYLREIVHIKTAMKSERERKQVNWQIYEVCSIIKHHKQFINITRTASPARLTKQWKDASDDKRWHSISASEVDLVPLLNDEQATSWRWIEWTSVFWNEMNKRTFNHHPKPWIVDNREQPA